MTTTLEIAEQLADELYGLHCDIGRLEVENAKLRHELDQWERLTANIELPEYPITEFKPKDLERENARLREDNDRLIQAVEDLHDVKLEDKLVQLENENDKLRELVKDIYVQFDSTIDWPDIERRIRELGIEVGE